MKFYVATLLALFALPAHAQDRPLEKPRIKANGAVELAPGFEIGRWQNNKFTSQPDKVELKGSGSTGAIDGMSATTGATTKSLSAWMGDLVAAQRLGGILRSQISQVPVPVTVNRFTVAGCTASGDSGRGSDYVRGTSTGPMAIQDALGVWWELAKVGVLDAGAFCIDLTGGADAFTALQSASNQAIAWGAKLSIPPGNIKTSNTIAINVPSVNNDVIGRFEISGAGRGLTMLQWAGAADGCVLKLNGGDGFAGHANASVSNLMVGGNGGGRGICANKLADLGFNEIFVQGLSYGYYLTDTLSTRWFGGTTSFNKYGLYATRVLSSGPNAFSFFGHRLANNAENGMELDQGSALNWSGGSIEGNGLSGIGAKIGGVFITNPGLEGGAAATFTGAYFEHNGGSADLSLTVGSSPVTLDVRGSHFNRLGSGYSTNPVVVNQAAGAGAVVANISASFRSYGGYVASSSRRYIAMNTAGQATLNDTGSFYQAAAEHPAVPTGRILARGRFDGTAATSGATVALTSGFGASVYKVDAGIYRIDLQEATGSSTKTVLTWTDFPLISQSVGENSSQVQFKLFDQSGSLRDTTSISFIVYDF